MEKETAYGYQQFWNLGPSAVEMFCHDTKKSLRLTPHRQAGLPWQASSRQSLCHPIPTPRHSSGSELLSYLYLLSLNLSNILNPQPTPTVPGSYEGSPCPPESLCPQSPCRPAPRSLCSWGLGVFVHLCEEFTDFDSSCIPLKRPGLFWKYELYHI